ncbi:MAG: hypothetical protein NT025_00005 [bacterium]|nr:hypothetical protein [bacterium]
MRPFQTLRDAKRYLNLLNFNYARLKGEVNLVDLWALTLFQVFSPDGFRWISTHKALLTQGFDWLLRYPDNTKREIAAKSEFENLLKAMGSAYGGQMCEIVRQVFPMFGRLVGGIGLSVSDLNLRVNKRVGCEENFDRYMCFGILESEISTDEFRELIDSIKDVTKFMLSLQKMKSKSADLFCRLEDELQFIDRNAGQTIIEGLLSIGDQFIDSREHSILTGGISSNQERTVLYLLKNKIPAVERYSLLARIMEGTSCAKYLWSNLLHLLQEECQQDDASSQSVPSERVLERQHVESLAKNFANRLERETSSFCSGDYIVSVIFKWYYHFGGTASARKTVRAICIDEMELLTFLQIVRDTPFGYETVLLFFDLPEIIGRLSDARENTARTLSQRELIDQFLIFFKQYNNAETTDEGKQTAQQS